MPGRRHRPNNAAKLAKRREQRARRRDREARERAAELAAMGADLVRIRDPDPEEAALAFERVFGSAPPPLKWTEKLFDELGSDRSRALAEAALRCGDSPGALALAADVALLLDENAAAAERRVDEALRQLDDSFLGLRKARALADQGKLAQAAATMGPVLADLPDLEEPQLLRGSCLAQLADLLHTPASACPCGSGQTFEACCATSARALIAEFHDRQPLFDLHHAVYAYAASSEDLERAAVHGIDEWVDQGAAAREEVNGWMEEDASDEGRGALPLALERAWSLPLLERDRTILEEFRDDPSTPPDLADRAEQWREWVAWGLWQVTEVGDPGVVVTNLVTGARLYAAITPELRDGVLPWAVLAGYFVPVDGVWRAGSMFYQASPEESRPLAELVLDAAEYLARKTRNPGLGGWVRARSEDLGQGWYLPDDAPADPDLARTIGVVCCSVFPRLVAQLRRNRARVPQTVNTDGEPVEWIEAELRVSDPAAARRALLEHPDFRDDEGEIGWLGEPVPPAAHEQSLAQLRSQGVEPPEDSEPGRYSRGTLRFDGSTVAVQVNSRGRFERLLALLADLGHPAEVVSEDVTDVMGELQQRMTWLPPGAPTPNAAEADEAWLRSLPDEPLPALDGLTPRQAAESVEHSGRLKLFAREMEYRLASRGSSITGEVLRERLGLS